MSYIIGFFKVQMDYIFSFERFAGNDWFSFVLASSFILGVLLIIEGYLFIFLLKSLASIIKATLKQSHITRLIGEYLMSRMEQINSINYENESIYGFEDEDYRNVA